MITIYGTSPDQVRVVGAGYIDTIHGEAIDFEIGDPGGGVRVKMRYLAEGEGGSWWALVGLYDDDTIVPWRVEVGSRKVCSVCVTIDCPGLTRILASVDGKIVWRDGKAWS